MELFEIEGSATAYWSCRFTRAAIPIGTNHQNTRLSFRYVPFSLIQIFFNCLDGNNLFAVFKY